MNNDEKTLFDTEPMNIHIFAKYAKQDLDGFIKNIKCLDKFKNMNLSSFQWYLMFMRWNECLDFLKENQ
jgi:hypothetical protein